VDEWSQKWLDSEKKDKGSKTYHMYRSMIVNHINPVFGKMYLDKVKAIDVKMFLNEKSKTMAKQTLNTLLNTLKQIFRTAFINNYIGRNNLEYLKAPASDKVKMRMPLETSQLEALKRVALTHPFGKLPMIMLYCGLRRGEVLALMKSDVGANTITVNKAIHMKSWLWECSFSSVSGVMSFCIRPETRASKSTLKRLWSRLLPKTDKITSVSQIPSRRTAE
jgi:integrase